MAIITEVIGLIILIRIKTPAITILKTSNTASMNGIGDKNIKISMKNLTVITTIKKYIETAKISNCFKTNR